MEFLFPLSMLGAGLVIGAVSLWFISRAKLQYEFERGRAAATTEHATLVERLAGKEDQVRQLREALDREAANTEELRNENSQTLSQLSALQTRLEDERRVNQEKLALLTNAEEKLDRKSTRLNSSHSQISYAVFCLKKKKKKKKKKTNKNK